MKIKKLFVIITAGMLTALHIASGVSAKEEERNNIVILGDSIATGYGLEGYDNTPDSGKDSFGSLLWAGSTDYANFAEDGRTAGDLLASLSDEQTAEELKKADTVVVSAGGNDLLKPLLAPLKMVSSMDRDFIENILNDEEEAGNIVKNVSAEVNNVDLEAVAVTIDEILHTVREYNSESDVYILTVYDAFEPLGRKYSGIAALSELADEKLTELNGYIKTAAENNGADVADIHSAFAGKAEEYTNINDFDIHPNKAGHKVIYNELLESGIKQVDFSQEKYEWFRNLRNEYAVEFSADSSKAVTVSGGSKMYEIGVFSASDIRKNMGVYAFAYSGELINDNDFKLAVTAYTKDGTAVNTYEKACFNIMADGASFGAAAVSAAAVDFLENTDGLKQEDISCYTFYVIGDFEDGITFRKGLDIFRIPLKGDISDNGEIDLYDAIEIARSLIGTRVFNKEEKEIADFNGDGKVDLYDAIGIAKYIISK